MTPACLYRMAQAGSTNVEAMRLLREGAPDGTVVWAERQTEGRGRMGRSWDSPVGNLYVSVISRPDLRADLVGRIAVACGRECAGTLRALTRLPVSAKWPNDLYLNGLKLGGILVEARLAAGDRVGGVVMGLGLNVAASPDVPPPGHPATHLAAHDYRPQRLDDILQPLAHALRAACDAAAGDDWLGRMRETHHLGIFGPVRVRQGSEEYEAEAVGLAEDGGLVLRRAGHLLSVASAEVSVRV